MTSILRAEFLKQKHTFSKKILWLAPITAFFVAFILTAGMTNAYSESVWNWWYTLLLPEMLAVISYFNIAKERKMVYYNQKTLPVGQKRLLLCKIIYMAIEMFFSNALLCLGAVLGGYLLGTSVPVGGAAIAIFVLTITYLWEIPVFLFLSARFGMIADVCLCFFISLAGTVIASSGTWWLFGFSIPMRVVCPFLRVLPNGMRAPSDSPLLDMGVVLPGIMISVCWFVAAVCLVLKWFEKKEVK